MHYTLLIIEVEVAELQEVYHIFQLSTRLL